MFFIGVDKPVFLKRPIVGAVAIVPLQKRRFFSG